MHIATSRDEALGMLSLLAAVALFSTVEIASKLIGPQVDPLILTFLRFFLTGAVLLVWSFPVLRLRLEPLAAGDYGIFCLNGLLGISLAYALYYFGFLNIPAQKGSMMFCIKPALASALAFSLGGQIQGPSTQRTL
ncbi:MAG: DMT family transporter [Syntrophus sp. (in: bacteria)]|nr:DMT family transporter [Syntrophus sp. (in: bacteria)]